VRGLGFGFAIEDRFDMPDLAARIMEFDALNHE